MWHCTRACLCVTKLIVTSLVQHLIIILLTINYTNSWFHSTFITLVIKTVHDVYFISSNNMLQTCNVYNYIKSTNRLIYDLIISYYWMTVHVLIKMTSFKQNVEDYTINTNTIVTALITLIKFISTLKTWILPWWYNM